jgi:hypothetical protein
LEEGVTALPDRVLDTVLDQLPATPQRRSWWPPRRESPMNTYIKAAMAVAAVLIVAVVGFRFLSPGDATSGGSSPTPVVTPSPAPTAAPVATVVPSEPPIPPAGALAPGRHSATLEGVQFTFAIANPGWVSNGSIGIEKAPIRSPRGAAFIFWLHDADGVFSDACAGQRAPTVGPTAADMAAAIAGMAYIEVVQAPVAVTIGGKPGQHLAVRIPNDIACQPEQFDLWFDDSMRGNIRWATDPGMTIDVWIVEVDGKRVQLDGETYAGASAAPRAELQAIIDSIEFD